MAWPWNRCFITLSHVIVSIKTYLTHKCFRIRYIKEKNIEHFLSLTIEESCDKNSFVGIDRQTNIFSRFRTVVKLGCAVPSSPRVSASQCSSEGYKWIIEGHLSTQSIQEASRTAMATTWVISTVSLPSPSTSAAGSCCIFTLAVRQPPVLASCIGIYYLWMR